MRMTWLSINTFILTGIINPVIFILIPMTHGTLNLVSIFQWGTIMVLYSINLSIIHLVIIHLPIMCHRFMDAYRLCIIRHTGIHIIIQDTTRCHIMEAGVITDPEVAMHQRHL